MSETTLRRFLIVPDKEFAEATLLRAKDFSTPPRREEEGIQVVPPEQGSTVAVGDLRPVMSGSPEKHLNHELFISQSGPSGRARWSYIREGDSEVQFKQSPMVVGRTPDCISRTVEGESYPYHNHPKLLPLESGSMLCVYVASEKAPAFIAQDLTDGMIRGSLYTPSGGWGTISDICGPGTTARVQTEPDQIPICIDVVQFPDTGEIVAALFTADDVAPDNDRRLLVLSSYDDGATWESRTQIYLDGTFVGLDIEITVGTLTSYPSACAMERLPSGRLVLAVRFLQDTVSIISDDRGATWRMGRQGGLGALSMTVLAEDGPEISSTMLRNGAMVVVEGGNAAIFVGPPPAGGWLNVHTTFDGEVWQTVGGQTWAPPRMTGGGIAGFGIAVVERENGVPMVYGSKIRDVSGSVGGQFWAVTGVPDLDLGMSLADWESAYDYSREWHNHVPGGSYTSEELFFHGWVGMDAVRYRGHVWMAAQWCNQDTGTLGTNPDLIRDSLMFFQMDFWQPLQERLGTVLNLTSLLWSGRTYNYTWDSYDLPSNVGFTLVGTAGTFSIAEDGYMDLNVAGPATGYYTNPTIFGPAPAYAGYGGVVRAICRVDANGSLTASDAVIRLELLNTGLSIKIEAKLEHDGAGNQLVEMWDLHAGTNLGSVGTFDEDTWLEILFGTWTDDSGDTYLRAFARAWDRSSDPDWEGPYTSLCDDELLLPVSSATEELTFGTIGTGSARTFWKGVHLARAWDGTTLGLPLKDVPPLEVPSSGSGYADDEMLNNAATGLGGSLAELRYDAGLTNFMRTLLSASLPTQWAERGARASWRGEAIGQGNFQHETDYVFRAPNMQATPVVQEWRSTEVKSGRQIEVVFESLPGDGFHPTAIAFFGRNWHDVQIQMSDVSDFSVVPVSFRVGIDFAGALFAGVDRSAVLWRYRGASSWNYDIEDRRLTVWAPSPPFALASANPWRPHQFASEETGQKFYLATIDGEDGSVSIYRIKDNTEDTLIFFSSVTAGDFAGNDWAIFSDRFAVTLDTEYVSSYSGGARGVVGPNSHLVGYRYMRFLLNPGTRRDSDEEFVRLGLVVPGQAFELGAPMPERGWTMGHESGDTINRLEDGTSFARRRSAVRRTWSCDYGYLLPAPDISTTDVSPSSQPDRRSWQTMTDLIRRMRLDGLHGALVWEGDQATAVGANEGDVPVQSNPNELAVVRMTEAGSIQNAAYDCGPVLVGGGVADNLPRPIMTIRGVKFVEEM